MSQVQFLFPQFFMATQKQTIKENLVKLEELYGEREAIERTRNNQLGKHQKAYNEATKPINERFDKKLSPLNSKIAALENEIVTAIESTKQNDGTFKLGKVESENLVVEAVSSKSAREVDAKTFFNSVPALKREAVWDAFKVLISKAEELVGKESLDKIAKVTTNWSVKIRRK